MRTALVSGQGAGTEIVRVTYAQVIGGVKLEHGGYGIAFIQATYGFSVKVRYACAV